jgi:MYXO-CTERM domain-containing protein
VLVCKSLFAASSAAVLKLLQFRGPGVAPRLRARALVRALVLVLVAGVALTPAVDASPSEGDGPAAAARTPQPVPEKARRFEGRADTPPVIHVRAGKRATGTLAGKAVYLSAGHGWQFASGAWRTQRGNTHGLVEDFITIESVNQYLIAYLHAMGAYVVPIRESDLNPNLAIVDDGDAVLEGDIVELPNQDVGWGAFATPFEDVNLRPFQLGGARTLEAAASETGRAVLAANIPEDGYYNVYVSYVQGPDRVPDAHFIVRHSGGESHARVDQRRHGSTWMLLGRWYFEAGGDAEVIVANDSAMPGGVISFDAVRFGGGMAPHAVGGVTTERPAYESAAAYSTQLLGAPRNVYDFFNGGGSNDVVARPRFAAWEHEAGEDAVYISWHTNAPDPGRGTMSIAYGNTFPCCRGLEDFAGTPGSLELLHAVHDELLADLRAVYDPAWRDARKVTAALGELSPNHNNEMPAILVEVAFHSTAADADALRDPRFRQISARAMAQGIARFFAAKDGRALVLPPEPPTAVRVENVGDGRLRVAWRPPAADPAGGDAPASYRVYVGTNGYGFDDGVEVTGESFVLEDLPRGALRFVRVAAVNEGGESLPSEVVGARLAGSGAAPVLVVGAFDRLDRFQMVRDQAPLVGTIDRMWLDRMNNGTAAVRHALALAAAGYAFDGATDEAITERDVDLTGYRAIDWVAGEDARVLAAPAREELSRFALAGGKLLVTGAELVWALDTQGDTDDQQFARDILRTSLEADGAGTYDVVPLDGPFAALGPLSFRDTGDNGYDAELADVLVPGEGAAAILAYGEAGDAGVAGIAWEGGIVVGFPLEIVQGVEARRELVDAAMVYFGVDKEPDVDPEPDQLGGCGCRSGGDAASLLLPLGVIAIIGRRRRR